MDYCLLLKTGKNLSNKYGQTFFDSANKSTGAKKNCFKKSNLKNSRSNCWFNWEQNCW